MQIKSRISIGLNVNSISGTHGGRGTGTYTRLLRDELKKMEMISVIDFTQIDDVIDRCDIFHFPYFDPFFLTLPKITNKPFIVTVHDLIPLAYPEHFYPGIRGKIKWFIQRNRIRKSSAIITDSIASKKDIIRFLSFPPELVHVIPLAPEPIYNRIIGKSLEVTEELRLEDISPFVLYIGDINWNKNIFGLLEALLITQEKGYKFNMVFVGRAFLDMSIDEARKIQQFVYENNLTQCVNFLGFVPDEKLKILMKKAMCVAQVSFAEGFGLPLINALSMGAITLTSNQTSLLEIAGPSILVNPFEAQSIADGLIAANNMPEKNRILTRKTAQSYASHYSWMETATQTAKVYETVSK